MKLQRKLFILFALAGALGLGSGLLLSRGIADHQTPIVMPKELVSYRDVVKRVLPAVVSVRVVSAQDVQVRGQRRLPNEAPAEVPEQFRDLMEEMQRQGEAPRPRPGQFGSGAIIDPKGVVVTNNHVVAGATAVQVTLTDGRVFTSRQIFTDPKTDLAIVKLDVRESLPFLEIGDSDAMEIGDRVLAVGAPFGLEGSVTHGIVSGKGRSAGMLLYEDFIQTDAAINPGNSGGPLVNLEGRIIGISTAIRTMTGGSQGVGLAVPARIVRDVTRQLTASGTVTRGYLGIRFGELNPEVAEKLGLDKPKGAVIGQVYPDTPASKAGLREGDVILGLNGAPLRETKEIQRAVSQAEVGEVFTLEVLRDGKKMALKVTIEAQPQEYGLRDQPVRNGRRLPGRRAEQPETLRMDALGIEVAELTPEMRQRFGYTEEVEGALITRVERESVGFQQGLRPGMVIAAVEQKPVRTPEDLEKHANQAALKSGLLLLVKTPQGSEYLVLKSEQE